MGHLMDCGLSLVVVIVVSRSYNSADRKALNPLVLNKSKWFNHKTIWYSSLCNIVIADFRGSQPTDVWKLLHSKVLLEWRRERPLHLFLQNSHKPFQNILSRCFYDVKTLQKGLVRVRKRSQFGSYISQELHRVWACLGLPSCQDLFCVYATKIFKNGRSFVSL